MWTRVRLLLASLIFMFCSFVSAVTGQQPRCIYNGAQRLDDGWLVNDTSLHSSGAFSRSVQVFCEMDRRGQVRQRGA
ncbi:hypothetical protein MYCTH_2303385 [Thermothelomyces thermophilus ATCC 42464]|uniref:Cyanovirin-N domain-containing protein n=1 Tax=Thermothelomyces thermophilus (strain ATCC 42464 / BCRC 31852 / DSM 1799) TaxID=573729 RepID=G2QCM5_THET4|nr:uncharacterized protein MYCTH_2303385 [Thermothelomyces thermophilus ATCC 42464]AEO57348.1 hypothetical protein MYCTH_2303385 [Thermothelomyces thermophilus ATCC 42464]